MNNEATAQQAIPHGRGRDITELAKSDIQEREFLAPENGIQTVELWIRSAALYLKATRLGTTLAGPEIARALIEDLEARAVMGAAKYGERLTAHNGRDADLDCYQELLDAWVYSRQGAEERESPRPR
jgi:hypothetical protein